MGENKQNRIVLAHGGGGRLMGSLIEKTILPRVGNDTLNQLGDAALLHLDSNSVCFATDSFVVKPLFFNGGDIGKLAVCGTVNDLAVSGAKPVAISLSLIIEEGFSMEELERILESCASAAEQAGVSIVTGDTKVVEAEAADGLFINTAGVGTKLEGASISMDRIEPGDKIVINGTLGDHGMTIISRRKGIQFDSPLKSDCAILSGLIGEVMTLGEAVKFMRDPTRGGVSATLNEVAKSTGHDVEIVEDALPVNTTVRAAAEMLGFDLLNIANEGKVVFIVKAEAADEVVKICRGHELGRDAAVIGEVLSCGDKDSGGIVEIVTRIGGRRIVQMPYGRELPRIC